MKKLLEPIVSVLILALILFILFVAVSRGQSLGIVASGGQFALEKQIVAGGGNSMTQSAFVQQGTGGQPISGTRSAGGPFQLYSGFWTPDDLVPTAATASISGRVITASGRGVRNAVLTFASPLGEFRSTTTGSLGYFSFAELEVGSTYVLTITSKRFTFANSVLLIEVNDDVRELVFTAREE
ncbi:MAG TPA: carboxypeptidase-like regulatory domain-containing protein [Pyrinomonadaceae bacterium]|nr:carboxypeptidase-like regulatory domain-containing protein [Pyrinomonadaceae bacterium]